MNAMNRKSLTYLAGALISLAAFCVCLIPAAPLFIKLLWPFPTIEQATRLSGRVVIEGGRDSVLMTPRSYVVTSTGEVEFKCGYFGARRACQDYRLLHDATGEVSRELHVEQAFSDSCQSTGFNG